MCVPYRKVNKKITLAYYVKGYCLIHIWKGLFMSKKGIKVGSVTYARTGRDLLQRNGYKAYLTRNPHPVEDEGCGYVIYVSNLDKRCFEILKKNNIQVKGTVDMGEFL